MTTVSVECARCSISFESDLRRVNEYKKKGWNHYCSDECHGLKKARQIERPCGTCGVLVSRDESQFKKSKSGHLFCNKSCSIKYNNRVLRSGVNNPWHQKTVRRAAYGEEISNSSSHYRTIAFAHHDKECVVCGEDKIVACHHMNGEHDDNRPENLVVLCPTHHGYWHSKWRFLIEDKVRAYQEQFFDRMISEVEV